MPYDKDNLPEAVKQLPEAKQAQWLEVWNSAFKKCQSDGGEDCEQSAFAQAWGVVQQAEPTEETEPTEEPVEPAEQAEPEAPDLAKKITDFLTMLGNSLKELFGVAEKTEPVKEEVKEEKEETVEKPVEQSVEQSTQSAQSQYLELTKTRSVSFPAIYEQTYAQLQVQDQMAMMYDIYFDDAGLFAICASEGKLFKIPVSLTDGTVALGEWEEIIVTQSRKPSFQIMRTKENRYRWVSISATAVLNRAGEIDSRQLFDNIIKRAEESGSYPIRVFFHAGQKFRTGQCDFLGRDENVLITSGLYDQSELAMREVKARLEEPEYWGDSISFYPMAPAQKVRANNVEIPVYIDGVGEEISTLPEEDAASWLTATPTIMEVNRMLSQRQMKAFVKLFENEEEAKKWLEENSATRNRLIVDTGMVTRAKRELAEIINGEATVPQAEEVSVPSKGEFELSEDALDLIADRIITRMDISQNISTALAPIGETITSISARVEALEKRFESETDQTTHTIAQALTRLNKLDRTEEQKRKEWFADLPEKVENQSSHRPRETRSTDRETPIEDILAKIPVKY